MGAMSRRWLLVWATIYGALVVLASVAHWTLPRTNEPTGCDGIGFGCTPPPNVGAVVWAVVVGVMLLIPFVISGLVVALLSRRRVRAQSDTREVGR